MFIIDFNKFWANNKSNTEQLDKKLKQDLNNLFNYFTPGKLYTNNVATPAYLSQLKLKNKKWEWLTQSFDNNNNLIPIMFINILSGSMYNPNNIPINLYYNSNTIYLHFLKGTNSIYVPITPGKEHLIFSPINLNNIDLL